MCTIPVSCSPTGLPCVPCTLRSLSHSLSSLPCDSGRSPCHASGYMVPLFLSLSGLSGHVRSRAPLHDGVVILSHRFLPSISRALKAPCARRGGRVYALVLPRAEAGAGRRAGGGPVVSLPPPRFPEGDPRRVTLASAAAAPPPAPAAPTLAAARGRVLKPAIGRRLSAEDITRWPGFRS